jgi:hypothetical protein
MWLSFALLLTAAAFPIQRDRPSLVESAKAVAAAAPAAEPAAPALSALQRSTVPETVAETLAALQADSISSSTWSRTRAMMSRVYAKVVQPVEAVAQQASPAQLLFTHVIILAILGFVWCFMCMGQQRSTMLVSRDELSGDLKPVGLCSCLSFKITQVAETLCCSVFMWAETAAKLGVGSFGLLLAAALFLQVLDNALITAGGPREYLGLLGGLLYLGIRLFVRTATLRRDLKQGSSNTIADAVYDFFSHLCCSPCAIAQEAEFVEHYEKHYPLQAV